MAEFGKPTDTSTTRIILEEAIEKDAVEVERSVDELKQLSLNDDFRSHVLSALRAQQLKNSILERQFRITALRNIVLQQLCNVRERALAEPDSPPLPGQPTEEWLLEKSTQLGQMWEELENYDGELLGLSSQAEGLRRENIANEEYKGEI